MITTKIVNVNLTRGKLKLRHVTTKTIDASIRVEPPKAPIKTKSITITTTTMADVADIAEKKRRDDIAKEQKLAINKKGKANKGFARGDAVYQKEMEKIAVAEKPKLVEPSKELMAELTKKPWNKMNAKERKEYQAEKARKREEKEDK